ncbi:MAG: glycosyltransferase family 1 protein [Candidatus Andersenbacteria bacterium]|nr:glycosyltransferase family 1 protein [Candidatus Andersenbacteria bacterium]
MKRKKILRVCSAGLYKAQYGIFFDNHSLSKLSFVEAVQKMREHGLLYPSGFRRHMSEYGWEVWEVVADFWPLQRLWLGSRVHGQDKFSLVEIFYRQIEAIRPDVVYYQELDVGPQAVRDSLKKRFPFIKLVAGFKGFPPVDFANYKDVDVVFNAYPAFAPAWQKTGVHTYPLPHCFDPGEAPANPREGKTSKRDIPFAFVGSTGYGNANQRHRYELLKFLLRHTDLQVWGLELPVNIFRLEVRAWLLALCSLLPRRLLVALKERMAFMPMAVLVVSEALQVKAKNIPAREWYVGKPPLARLFPGRVHAPVSGQDYLRLMGKSQVVLNMHTDVQGEAGNIRMFEATGMGACLLVDRREGLASLFADNEMVIFTSPQDCLEKAKELLAHPSRTRKIAGRGQERTLRQHTSKQRCSVINGVLKDMLG